LPAEGPIPSKEEILEFIRLSKDKVTKRQLCRAFDITGQDKIFLKRLLREMLDSGDIVKDPSHSFRPADQLPDVIVAEFAGMTDDGDPLLKLADSHAEAPSVKIFLSEKKKSAKKGPALGPGDKALVRLDVASRDPVTYRASIIKHLGNTKPETLLGVFKGGPNGGRIQPVDKKNRKEYTVDQSDCANIRDGELVVADIDSKGRRIRGMMQARIREKLGNLSEPRSISRIAIHAHGIPVEFPAKVTAEADAAVMVTTKNRTDLRDIDLITIDPADARDHDDAIFAEPDTDPNNEGGWHLVVAIADVANYVSPGSMLDIEAKKRGNSCYFPDRVVPMLPEVLSNGLCSLKPDEDRACMALHIWITKSGKKLRHAFQRGIMRSRANISYEDAQAALSGHVSDNAAPWLETVLKPLHGAWKALMIEREKRAPLELELAERKIIMGEDGQIESIAVRDRFDTHRIVEEMMVLSNVCAAEELEKHRVPAMYRVHEVPSFDKLEALRDFLRTLDLNLAKGQVAKPRMFNGILGRVRGTDQEHLINQMVLRSQTQAYYSPENEGHFGLALERYAHFTSPIRRYSDLLVHRGLIKALKLGSDGLTDAESADMETIGQHISDTERRAMAAERDSTDRYMAAYMSGQVGDVFDARVRGVTNFGLFVEVLPAGADGLIPMSTLYFDYYVFDQASQTLVGERSGHTWRLGQMLQVKLMEADPYTGGLKLEVVPDETMPKGGKHPDTRRNSGNRFKQKGRRGAPACGPKQNRTQQSRGRKRR